MAFDGHKSCFGCPDDGYAVFRRRSGAGLVFAAGIAALTYQTYDNHRELVESSHSAMVLYPHYRLIIAGEDVFAIGLVLAATGFLVLGVLRNGSIDAVPLAVAVDDTRQF